MIRHWRHSNSMVASATISVFSPGGTRAKRGFVCRLPRQLCGGRSDLVSLTRRILIGARPDSRGTFSLLVQRKSTQEERTPGSLAFGSPHPSLKTGNANRTRRPAQRAGSGSNTGSRFAGFLCRPRRRTRESINHLDDANCAGSWFLSDFARSEHRSIKTVYGEAPAKPETNTNAGSFGSCRSSPSTAARTGKSARGVEPEPVVRLAGEFPSTRSEGGAQGIRVSG